MAKRDRVYMDLEMGDKELGRVTFELYNDVVPKTAENFRTLCSGEKGFGYKGTKFHRIIKSLLFLI